MKISYNIISYYLILQLISIGCNNGLVPNRQRAIVWTNIGPIYWCIYGSLGIDELKEICGSG